MKILNKSFKGTMLAGTNEAFVSQELDTGDVIVACLFAVAPSKDLNIKIVDTSGSPVVDYSNYKDWLQRQGGDYYTSKKPMSFSGGQKVKVVVTSVENQTADWDFEVMLVIKQP